MHEPSESIVTESVTIGRAGPYAGRRCLGCGTPLEIIPGTPHERTTCGGTCRVAVHRARPKLEPVVHFLARLAAGLDPGRIPFAELLRQLWASENRRIAADAASAQKARGLPGGGR